MSITPSAPVDPLDPVDPVEVVDVVVIGGGQSGLAVGYHLRRLDRRRRDGATTSFVVLDDHPGPGGAWQDMWPSLRLFSPASYSSLPGRPMPPAPGPDNPDAAHVVAYLADYERRYDLPVRRPVTVREVRRDGGRRLVVTDAGTWSTRVVVNATGTWRRPFWPHVPGAEDFRGPQVHTAGYRGPDALPGERVLVVGGGNSGAQVAADLLAAGRTVTWVARHPPRMLPDDVDGRVLFETATRAVQDRAAGRSNAGVADLGDVVAVPSVRHARDHLSLRAEPMVERLLPHGARWPDGREVELDAVVWCTGFRPALRHLAPLRLSTRHGHPLTAASTPVEPRRDPLPPAPVTASDDPQVLLVGYGDWCGPASATLIGVNRAAREAASLIHAATA